MKHISVRVLIEKCGNLKISCKTWENHDIIENGIKKQIRILVMIIYQTIRDFLNGGTYVFKTNRTAGI